MPVPALPGAEPFDLAGGPAGAGDSVLLLHGLSGTPFELLPVAERLHRAGMRCLGPLMAGHGGEPGALSRLSYTDWVAEAERQLLRLEGSRRTLVVGGSMGALVACVLAHEHPDRVDGLALLAPALRLPRLSRLAAVAGQSRLLGGLVVPKMTGSDVRDPEMRRRNPCMRGIPLRAVAELRALEREVERLLPGIVAPALVVMGARDHTVQLSGARRLARRIGSGPARLVILPESWHLVGIDVERDRCAEEVLDFFGRIPVPRAPSRTAGRAGGADGGRAPRE